MQEKTKTLRLDSMRMYFLVLFCCLFPGYIFASDSPTIGMYGLPVVKHDKTPAVSAVFVPPDLATIHFYNKHGAKVFLTLNVFGGKQPWKEYPDAIPITADGSKMSGMYGGVCPTHYDWRENRLQLLKEWLERFNSESAISGVWLDFIRYPGSWKHTEAVIPDTCYCNRCLSLFQVERGVEIPKGMNTADTSKWIKNHAAAKWLEWKKEQIVSFVRDAKEIISAAGENSSVKLGIFLVPWMQGEKNAAVTFLLAQDAEQIGQYADILSPMLYHEMVGQQTDWILNRTEYFSAITDKKLWPIIQAENISTAAFKDAVAAVGRGTGDGILVYRYSRMKDEFWPLLNDFSSRKDILVQEEDRKTCQAGKEYLFEGEFFREKVIPRRYPEVSLWGKTFLLNTHRIQRKFQPIRVHFTCTEEMAVSDSVPFEIVPGLTEEFSSRNPHLYQKDSPPVENTVSPKRKIFPVGAYGGNVENISEFKELGLNSTILGLSKEAVVMCEKLDMHCTFSLPRDVEKIKLLLDRVGPIPANGHFAFYVNDEPGIHSFPRWKAKDIHQFLKSRYPEIPTMMAVVRPQVIPDYTGAADYFMLDQYPVPSMPMTWLSDSMDTAAETVGRQRLYSIIQAFGGERWAKYGWPRLPTYEEMNCLAFLSVLHGSRGIYFYKYQEAVNTEMSKGNFEKVVSNLLNINEWLTAKDNFVKIPVKMVSENSVDPSGKPAIHCGEKRVKKERLLICVNTIKTYVAAEIPVSIFGDIREKIDFTPYEVKLYVN